MASMAERFWAKVDKDGPIPAHCPELGPCWVWTAGKAGNGYGVIREAGRGSASLSAHRVGWIIQRGPIPEGLNVLHHCDNRACVRDSHLHLGTTDDNAKDRLAHGVRLDGSRHPMARLNEDMVAAIRRDYRFGQTTQGGKLVGHGKNPFSTPGLAEKYGIDQCSVWRIVNGLSWKKSAGGVL